MTLRRATRIKHTKPIKAVQKGQVLLKETPFVHVLKSTLRHERCDFCFQSGQVLKCSGCKYVSYCGKKCQVNGWETHRDECKKLKRITPRVVPDAARFLARLIFRLKRGGESCKGFYTENDFRVFKDLMSHYSDIKKDWKRMEHFESLYNVLREYIGEDDMPNSAELLGMYGRLVVNGFNILDPEMISLGTGIYLGVSVIDHSCEPTAVAVFQGTTIYIRSLVDMPDMDWSKVFISYIELLNSPQDRQKELMETYYFLCECSRCKDVEQVKLLNSMTCPDKSCSSPVPVQLKGRFSTLYEAASCPSCGESVAPEVCKKYQEALDYVALQLQNMKNFAYLDVCKLCLEKQGELFHPLDLQRVKVLDSAFESSVTLSRWSEARHFGNLLLPGYKKYYGELHPLTGILYMKMAKICLLVGGEAEVVPLVSAAERVLRITHGTDHTLYQDQLLPLMAEAQLSLSS